MEFINYNHNPFKIKTGDCVIRAVSFGLNETWQDTYKGMLDVALDKGYAISWKDNIEEYLKRKGLAKQKMPRKSNGKKYTVKEFADNLAEPNKAYIIQIANHFTCIKNKNLYDLWNCGYKCVLNYWVV